MSYIRLKILFNKNNDIDLVFWDVKALSPQWEILRRRSSGISQDVKASFLIVRAACGLRPAERRLISSGLVFAEVDGS
jgi:hypothetical protein